MIKIAMGLAAFLPFLMGYLVVDRTARRGSRRRSAGRSMRLMEIVLRESKPSGHRLCRRCGSDRKPAASPVVFVKSSPAGFLQNKC